MIGIDPLIHKTQGKDDLPGRTEDKKPQRDFFVLKKVVDKRGNIVEYHSSRDYRSDHQQGLEKKTEFLPQAFLIEVPQIPVRHFPRVAGVSKYNLWNRLVSPFMDCFAYRWMKKRYINYQVGDNNLGC